MFICSPVPDIEWISPQNTIIRNVSNKYEIIDNGRVLTILKAKQKDEGVYYCKGKGKTESGPQSVNLNVTCRIFVPFLENSFKVYTLIFIEIFLIK